MIAAEARTPNARGLDFILSRGDLRSPVRWHDVNVRSLLFCSVAIFALISCSEPRTGAWTGYAEADLVYVAAPVEGRLQKLSVARGDRVESGALLFELERDVESLARAAAEARLQQAQSELANLQKGKRPPEIAAVEQQIAQARATLVVARSDYDRERDLAKRGFVSAGRLDNLKAEVDRSEGRVRELEAQLSMTRQPARSDEIAAAEAQARAARAELGRDQWRLDKTQQKSPAAGAVYDVLFRIGEQVPVAAPVVVLLPDAALKARFFVPQAALAGLKVGAPVALRCDGCPANLTATISFISPKAEFTPPVIYSNEARDKLVFMVEAAPDAAARAVLKPGMPLDVAPASR